MRSRVKLFSIVSLVVCSFAANVYADCSADNKSDLLSCASNSVLACRNQFPTCDKEPEQVISVQDVLDKASTKCCAITGKKKVARQKACIFLIETDYQLTIPRAHVSLKPFLRAAKKELTAFRKEGCSTGSN